MCCWAESLYSVQVIHEDFDEGIIQVQAKKRSSLNYYVCNTNSWMLLYLHVIKKLMRYGSV